MKEIIDTSTTRKCVVGELIQMMNPKAVGASTSQVVVQDPRKVVGH